MTRSFLILFIIAGVFSSCKERSSRHYNQFLNVEMKEIVDGIAKENVIMGSAVGYAGIRPKQWDRYEALLTNASDKDLVTYTDHNNPTVRCYSFDALVTKKNPSAFQILLKHLKDSAQVKTLFGCIGGSQPVGEYFLEASRKLNLTLGQKQIIDSILIFDKEITLNEKYTILDSLKKGDKHYGRIRQMVLGENDFKATPALARYKKPVDVPIITELLKSSDSYKQYYGFLSVINYPHPVFFPNLKQLILNKVSFSTKYGYESNSIRRALYSAIIQYKSLSARNLLETELQSTEGQDWVTKSDLIFQALKQYPDSIYIGVVKFNFYN